MHYLGIDVSATHLDTCLLDDAGRPHAAVQRFTNDTTGIMKLHAGLDDPPHTIVVFESTGVYGKLLAKLLFNHVAMLCQVNPRIIKNAAVSMTATKTDQADAIAIAQAAYALDKTQPQVLKQSEITGKINENLAVWLHEFDRLRRAIAKLKQQRNTLTHNPASAAEQIIRKLDAEIKRLVKSQDQARLKIESLADDHNVTLVASIKGVGKLTAAAVCCKIADVRRFDNADQLKAYFGLYPRRKQSGKREGKARMAKHGNALIRHLMWNCAKSAARWNPTCKALFDRLITAGHCAQHAWGAVARKLMQIIYGVLKTQTPWNPNGHLTANG